MRYSFCFTEQLDFFDEMINDSMRFKLRQLARRMEEIDGMLADPVIGADMNRFRDLSRERADIEPIVLKLAQLWFAHFMVRRLYVM